MKRKRPVLTGLSLLFSLVMLFQLSGCSAGVQASDLMEGIVPKEGQTRQIAPEFERAFAGFAVSLLQNTSKTGENTLISPLSAVMALAMTANGADTQTREEMETVLGGGVLPLEELNNSLFCCRKALSETQQLKLANSIWFRDDQNRLTVELDFLQMNADYFGAGAYAAPFGGQTAADINTWVKEKTDGRIENIVDEIPHDTMLYLINALAFEAEWETPYEKSDVSSGTFTNFEGTEQTAEMMYSTESRFLEDVNATGFLKDYRGGAYRFAVFLPKEGSTVEEYVDSLTAEGFLAMISEAKAGSVSAALPKFSCGDETVMNDALISMGMPAAFDSGLADFSRMGNSPEGNLFIGEVLQKTYIAVDELGTKAGAATKVEMKNESAMMTDYTVTLDRPFVYAILDGNTNLPIFLGTVMDLS